MFTESLGGATVEIYSLLKKDHETISSLFEKLEQTSGRAKKAREKIFAEIKLTLNMAPRC